MKAAVQNACVEYIDKHKKHVAAQRNLTNALNEERNTANIKQQAAVALIKIVQDTIANDEWGTRYFIFDDKILEVGGQNVYVRDIEK